MSSQPLGPGSMKAVFAQDAYYLASSDSASSRRTPALLAALSLAATGVLAGGALPTQAAEQPWHERPGWRTHRHR